jgi:hypothetical protein
VLAAQALLLGQAALADRNRAKTPGTITTTGYIRDRAGNPQPVWKVRAGDTIAITNFPNDAPRLIVETDYNDETKQLSCRSTPVRAARRLPGPPGTNAVSAAGLG